jgi:hypothetical protein
MEAHARSLAWICFLYETIGFQSGSWMFLDPGLSVRRELPETLEDIQAS